MSDDSAPRPRPPLARDLAAGAVVGAFAGAGVGVASLAVGIAATIVAAAESPFPLNFLSGRDAPWDPTALPLELASRGVELAVLVLVGCAFVAIGCIVGWGVLGRRDADARRAVRDAVALTLLVVVLVGTATGWLAMPSRALDDARLSAASTAAAIAVGAVAAPVGAALLRASSALAERRARTQQPIDIVGIDALG
ncbi:hypothetical protein [Agrococcus jejuensis]|uniref:Uncharacterized protein n=1 Tax=Agrococcus jejuensis TaxID=399736 RepID=A0A1G8CM18_9MICO|nr:hypothetical protein [Agrococcus jejuensis]SDH46402.1 hypothetical protein SAMN04489720_1335 [Agrococcus jejuensis]